MPTSKELVTLMTEEVKNFENAVKRLEELCKNLSHMDLRPNLDEVQNALNQNVDEHIRRQERSLKVLQNFVTNTVESQKQPRWLIISKLGLVFLSFLFVFYSFYKIESVKDLEKNAFDRGQDKVLNHFKKFLIDNEEASILYDEWLNNN